MDLTPSAKKTPSPAAVASKAAASLLYFAAELEKALSSNSTIDSSDLEHYTARATDPSKLPARALSADTAHRLESTGRRIWNACLRLQSSITSTDDDTCKTHFYTRARLFGYLLLGLGLLGRKDANAASSIAYLIRLGLALSKVCINTSDLDSARISLQKLAEYLESDSYKGITSSTDGQTGNHVAHASYYILRIALSWKDDRLDLAEHMYTKAAQHAPFLDTATVTTLVQILTQIGYSLITASNLAAALRWLRRAAELSSSPSFRGGPATAAGAEPTAVAPQEEALLPPPRPERERARIAVIQGLVTCLTGGSPVPGSLEEASRAVTDARAEFGQGRVEVMEMAARVHAAAGEFDALADTLRDMAEMSSESAEAPVYCAFMLEYVEKISKEHSETAAGVLDDMLARLLRQPTIPEILSKAVMLRLRLYLQCTEQETIWECFHLLDCIHFSNSVVIQSAVQEIHSMLWKVIQPLFHSKQYAKALSWCHLAQHSPALTTHAVPSHLATLARKTLSCHVELGEYAAALAVFQNLPAAAADDDDNGGGGVRDHILTRFLVFRLALRGWHQALAHECICFFAERPDRAEARDALYACVREAQSTGDRLCAAEALRAAAQTWRGERVVSANLPSLLRCTIRLLQLVAAGEQGGDEAADTGGLSSSFANGTMSSGDFAHVFQLASEFVSQNVHDENGHIVFTTPELHWLMTNSYNLGIVHCTSWEPGPLASLFQSCLVFVQALLSSTASSEETCAEDTTTIITITVRLRCHFILASLYISGARVSDSEHSASLYADVALHASSFQSVFQQSCASSAPEQYPDLLDKYGILCVFHFEALTFQSAWDRLCVVLHQARVCEDVDVFKAMGDCLMSSVAPPQVMSSILKQIVNEIFQLEAFNSDRLAQYLRCIMQTLLPMSDDGFVRQILDQAIEVASEAKEVGVCFPATEAEWLAAAAFNHGLTRYAAARNDMATCHIWLDKAISIAQYVNDDGIYAAALQDRQAKLASASLMGTLQSSSCQL